ncbi:hypothetical protein BDD12DRAFT_801857 [Trichophaea hybrida]|nr:hypothetical protein BDD12DRAFT_801857 [Trichophaea hybrida]
MSSNYYYRSSSSSRSQWPPAIRPLITLQILLSAVILLSTLWARFKMVASISIFSIDGYIRIGAAAFTLLSGIFNISSSAANLTVVEVVVPDTVSLALWAGLICRAVVRHYAGIPTVEACLLSAVLMGKLVVAASVRVCDTRGFDEEAAVDAVVVVMVDEKTLVDNSVEEVDGHHNSNGNTNM